MSARLRFGILGCARICRRGVIEGIRQSGVAELVAIASRDRETARRWAEEFGIPRHYGSYDQLVADPSIDAVYNPLPNEHHRPWSLAAAERGKHVLCEKPLGLNYADAEALVLGCRQHGVILMEAFMWRHHPRTRRALEMVRAGEIGELRAVKMDFSFQIDRGDWRLLPQHGGGALLDLSCYAVNAARLFTGEEPVECHAGAFRYPSGVDISNGVRLRFPGGVHLLADASFECPYRNRFEIVGTEATLEFPDGVLPVPETTLLVRRPSDDGETRLETIRFPRAQQYTEEIKAFCASVAAGHLVPPAEDGLANMRVLDALQKQIAAGWAKS